MSRAQGDGFRTWTDVNLNKYRARLDRKLAKLAEQRVKWYEVGDFRICCVTRHLIENRRGHWKWDGWEIVGDGYRVSMYEAESVRYTGEGAFALGGYQINGLPVLEGHWETTSEQDAKDKANEFFRMCKGYALVG